jgi:programmed cell death protein 5
MGEEELAELRRRRLEQLQRQSLDQQSMEEELHRQKQADAQIHHILLQVLEPDARERLANIKLTKPDFARAIEQQLVALAQSGRLKQKITDAQLKELLQQLVPQKKDWNIRRA